MGRVNFFHISIVLMLLGREKWWMLCNNNEAVFTPFSLVLTTPLSICCAICIFPEITEIFDSPE